LRALLVRGIILQTRPKKSAAAYAKNGGTKVHRLWLFLKECMKKLKQLVDVPVSLAMRYGNPSLLSGLQELHDKGVTEVMLFPLYPQHAMASTTTILELAEEHRQKY
jgi:ferrochelatase